MWYTADELSVQKAACRMTDWTPASSCNSQQQQQHGVQSTPADDLWMLNVRHCPYLYVKDGCRGDDGGRRSRHLARFPRYDVTATAAAAYEPPFVDCSSLFANHHQHNDDTRLHDSSSAPDFQKDTWTVTESKSSASHRRLNYSS